MAWLEGRKDMLSLKNSKSISTMMGMTLLVVLTLLGLYVWLISLKQMSPYTIGVYHKVSPRMVVSAEQCLSSGVQPGDRLYLHYPRPETYSRGECTCNPVRFFAILSMQRSGSGWFETLLNSHLNISSNGEIFSVKERRSNVSAVLSTLDRVYNLDWFSSAAKNECSAAVGFKWMLNQGILKYHKDIVDYFNQRGVSGIFLLRKNLLHRVISILANSYDQDVKPLNGTHKSHVHSHREAEVLAHYKPKINVSLLLPDLKRAEEMAADALEYFKSTRHIILFYEDLVNNHTKLMDVQDFLKVPRRKLVSRQVKIHTKPLPEQVENWEDVYNALKGTKYSSFLDHQVMQAKTS